MKQTFKQSEKGSVMLEYIVVLAAIFGLMAAAEFMLFGTLFDPFGEDGGELQKRFAANYRMVVEVIALPFP